MNRLNRFEARMEKENAGLLIGNPALNFEQGTQAWINYFDAFCQEQYAPKTEETK